MEKNLERARKHKFHSLHYVAPNDPIRIYEDSNYSIILEREDTELMVYWACESITDLLEGLHLISDEFRGEKIKLKFIPPEFVNALENHDYKVCCEFVDFWIKDLNKHNWSISDTSFIRSLNKEEISVASEVTQTCSGLSRGFEGEEEISIKEWLEGESNEVFAAIEDDEVIGICMMSVYDSNSGKVAWLRELAVNPKFQRRGIGRSLAKYGIEWGVNKGAIKSFLATDIENTPAINLYKELGYVQASNRGEIVITKHL
ncbi:GNAT family N-acetyltransferase [Fusibacter sp. JL298sf-3]